MNRDFIYNLQGDRPSAWSRVSTILNKVLWGALCCGVPGAPCYYCTCFQKRNQNAVAQRDRPLVNQSTGTTVERLLRPRRPHAPGRKSTPEMLSAVRCALSQLQGEPAPPLPKKSRETIVMQTVTGSPTLMTNGTPIPTAFAEGNEQSADLVDEPVMCYS